MKWIVVPALIAIAALGLFTCTLYNLKVHVFVATVLVITITCAIIWIWNKSLSAPRKHSEESKPVTVESDGEVEVLEGPPASPAEVKVPPASPEEVKVPPASPEEVKVPPASPEEVKVPPASPEEVKVPPASPEEVKVPPAGPEEEVDASSLVPLKIKTLKEVTITNQRDSIQFTDYGLSIGIPENCLRKGICQVLMIITVYCHPIFFSALYHFELRSSVQPLQQPITLSMEHCVIPDHNKHLSFFRSTDGKRFSKLEGGIFSENKGEIQRHTFSWYGIMDKMYQASRKVIKRLWSGPILSYKLVTYLNHQDVNRFDIIFIRALTCLQTKVEEDYGGKKPLACPNFCFEEENKELDKIYLTLLHDDRIRLHSSDPRVYKTHVDSAINYIISPPQLSGWMCCKCNDNCYCELRCEGTNNPAGGVKLPCHERGIQISPQSPKQVNGRRVGHDGEDDGEDDGVNEGDIERTPNHDHTSAQKSEISAAARVQSDDGDYNESEIPKVSAPVVSSTSLILSQLIAQLEGTPTMPELLSEKLNVAVQIGIKYSTFGIHLLDDKTGAIVEALEIEYSKNAERINTAILQRWLQGKGVKPVSWSTLLAVMKKNGI